MRGTDLTPEQLKAAEKFIMDRSGRAKRPEMVMNKFDDLVRLVAWYGAIRFVAGRDGIGGTLEKPADPQVIHQEQTA
jgi:hypothetical protein